MKKINRSQFFKYLGNDAKKLFQNVGVTAISPNDILELSIGKKFFYHLNDDCYFHNLQENLLQNFLNGIPLNNSAYAFRKNLSYLDFFEPHRTGFYFMRLDITNFFHSISEELLKDCFSEYFNESDYIDDEKNQKLVDGFLSFITYKVPNNSPNDKFREKSILPIGFKTSPAISNIVFRKLDILIQKYCSSKNIVYSRYADDMLFSSPKSSKFVHSDSFFDEIKYLLSLYNFKLNKLKTIKSVHTISLNGYVIEHSSVLGQSGYIRISNKKTKIIEKLVHELDKEQSPQKVLTTLFGFHVSNKKFRYYPPKAEYVNRYCRDQLLNKITGYRSFLISIIRFNEKFKCVNNDALDKYKELIKSLNKYINVFSN